MFLFLFFSLCPSCHSYAISSHILCCRHRQQCTGKLRPNVPVLVKTEIERNPKSCLSLNFTVWTNDSSAFLLMHFFLAGAVCFRIQMYKMSSTREPKVWSQRGRDDFVFGLPVQSLGVSGKIRNSVLCSNYLLKQGLALATLHSLSVLYSSFPNFLIIHICRYFKMLCSHRCSLGLCCYNLYYLLEAVRTYTNSLNMLT